MSITYIIVWLGPIICDLPLNAKDLISCEQSTHLITIIVCALKIDPSCFPSESNPVLCTL